MPYKLSQMRVTIGIANRGRHQQVGVFAQVQKIYNRFICCKIFLKSALIWNDVAQGGAVDDDKFKGKTGLSSGHWRYFPVEGFKVNFGEECVEIGSERGGILPVLNHLGEG